MTLFINPAADIGTAWRATMEAVEEIGGTATHVITTVTEPGTEDPVVRSALEATLARGRDRRVHSVETVAATIFPVDLYRSQPQPWAPELPRPAVLALDEAAEDLFSDYAEMIPLLATEPSTTWGTYFGRMVSWRAPNGTVTNQLAERVTYLRRVRSQGHRRANGADIALGGEGEAASADVGVQIHASTDRRDYGGPCLVHLDLSVHEGRLHLLAVYRHWHLVTRGYGNLLGLSRLLIFLGEQSGYPIGELAVAAGTASTERNAWGGQRGLRQLMAAAGGLAGREDRK